MRIEDLKLDSRSLTYSRVELTCSGRHDEFFTGGIPDELDIEETEGYQEFVRELEDEAEIGVHVETFNVGRGQSERPDDEEINAILENEQAIEAKYGIDAIQDSDFTRLYEPEEEM